MTTIDETGMPNDIEPTEPVAGERTGVIIGILIAALLLLLVALFWRDNEIPNRPGPRAFRPAPAETH